MKSLTRDAAQRWSGPRGEWTEAAVEKARVMALRGKVQEAAAAS